LPQGPRRQIQELAALLQRMALVVQVVVAVHGFPTDTLLQALPCVLSSSAAPPRLASVFGCLESQQFLEPIEVGITKRRGDCRRRRCGTGIGRQR
jgi:hypothetical protein